MTTPTFLKTILCGAAALSVLAPAWAGNVNYKHHTATLPSYTEEAAVRQEIGDIQSEATFLSHFRADLQVRGQAVSNAALLGSHGDNDFLFLPTLDVGYNVPMGAGFSLDAAGRVETATYARNDERSFWGYSGRASLDWRGGNQWPRIWAGVEPYRFVSFDDGDDLAEALGVGTGIDQCWVFNRGHTLVALAYSFTSYFADPALDDRDVHRVIASVTHQFTPQFYGQAMYAWQYSTYDRQGRDDSRHIAGLNLIYQFNEHLFGTFSTTSVANNSNRDLAQYENATAGLGLDVRF
jgi:hypothetical protein